jgi:hypothetical protein
MADPGVILGGFAFADWEVPSRMPFGGEQAHEVHKLIGGTRQVDAMGSDPSDISWSGRFRGPDAIFRAQTLDAMRIAGAAVDLFWLGIDYTVLITKFVAETEKAYEVPYSITCVVTDEPGGAAAAVVSTVDALVSADLSSALSFASF